MRSGRIPRADIPGAEHEALTTPARSHRAGEHDPDDVLARRIHAVAGRCAAHAQAIAPDITSPNPNTGLAFHTHTVNDPASVRGRANPASGYAIVESQQDRGYATAAVEALVAKMREASEVRRFVAHTPLECPESGRALEKAGFAMARETDDTDEAGNVLRVEEWELAV
jgi:Acetyltransferase (GNAT) domain